MSTIIKSQDIKPLLTGRTPIKIDRLLSYYLKESEIPLSKEQWSVMAVLWKKDGCTQQEIADATFRGRAGVTRLLDNLQKRGLVERKPDKNDRRSNLIFLTKEGASLETPVVKILNKTIKNITNNIEADQIHNLRLTLDQINKNIDLLHLKKNL